MNLPDYYSPDFKHLSWVWDLTSKIQPSSQCPFLIQENIPKLSPEQYVKIFSNLPNKAVYISSRPSE